MSSERKVNLAYFFGRNEYSVSYILLSQEYSCSPGKGYTYQRDHIKKDPKEIWTNKSLSNK